MKSNSSQWLWEWNSWSSDSWQNSSFSLTVSEPGEVCLLHLQNTAWLGADSLIQQMRWMFPVPKHSSKLFCALKNSSEKIGYVFFTVLRVYFFLNRQMLVQQNQLLQRNRSVESRQACFLFVLLEREGEKKRWLWPCFQKRWGTNYFKWRKNKYCFFGVAINALLPQASWQFPILPTGFWPRARSCWREPSTTCEQGAPTRPLGLSYEDAPCR